MSGPELVVPAPMHCRRLAGCEKYDSVQLRPLRLRGGHALGAAAQAVRLDPTVQGEESGKFESRLRDKVVGQDEAVQAVVDLYRVFRAGLHSPGRPVGNSLFLGPRGTGETRIVEVAAEALFGDSRAVIKVECAEFQHSHEIAKLIGSPPGYLVYRETHSLITQEALARYYTDELKITFSCSMRSKKQVMRSGNCSSEFWIRPP
jgi:Cdc48 subfamily AAA family protein